MASFSSAADDVYPFAATFAQLIQLAFLDSEFSREMILALFSSHLLIPHSFILAIHRLQSPQFGVPIPHSPKISDSFVPTGSRITTSDEADLADPADSFPTSLHCGIGDPRW